MSSLQDLIAWRNRRWRAVVSALKPTTRRYSLRELLESLEAARNGAPTRSFYLDRLISLVEEDLATAERFPERRGGPDTRRPLSAWRSRYNHLDRYLEPESPPGTIERHLGPDDAIVLALSTAEYEGWPVRTSSIREDRPLFRPAHRLTTE